TIDRPRAPVRRRASRRRPSRASALKCAPWSRPCPTDLLYPIGAARHVELGWGVSGGAPPADVRFTAELRTRNGRPEVLVEDGVSDATAPWSSRFIDLPDDAAGGTLALRTRGASSASHWAPPAFSAAPVRSSNRSVVVVSLDTVRADHLNAYGY